MNKLKIKKFFVIIFSTVFVLNASSQILAKESKKESKFENKIKNINIKNKNDKSNEKTIKKQIEEPYNKLLIPIKLKTEKNPTLEYVSKYYLTKKFLQTKNIENALKNSSTTNTLNHGINFLGSYIGSCATKNKKLNNAELNFYYKDFEKYVKNLKITKEDFEKTKEDFMKYKDAKHLIKKYKINKEIIENFLKNGYEQEIEGESTRRFFKVTKKTPKILLFNHFVTFISDNCFFKNFEEYVKYSKILIEFIKKYDLNLEDENNIITKKFAKDFLENVLKPMEDVIKYSYKLERDFTNKIDEISLKDFINCVKSAKPVEKEQLEKDQKQIKDLEKTSSYLIFWFLF